MIDSFQGKTWIAYFDIMGFKQFMDEEIGLSVLNKYYDEAYRTLKNNTQNIDGIFFSDSGVIFIRHDLEHAENTGILENLNKILLCIKSLNTGFLTPTEKWEGVSFLTKCAVAFGEFNWQKKEEHEHISKGPIYGKGYVKAILSVEKDIPHKMEIGEVRIVLDSNLKVALKKIMDEEPLPGKYSEFKYIYQFSNDHCYYSWTYRANPNSLLNTIREESNKELKKIKSSKEQEMFKKQTNLYRKWVNSEKEI